MSRRLELLVAFGWFLGYFVCGLLMAHLFGTAEWSLTWFALVLFWPAPAGAALFAALFVIAAADAVARTIVR